MGHRVVHGGEQFSSSVIIDDEVKENHRGQDIELGTLDNPSQYNGGKPM